MKLLLHACCASCAVGVLEKLKYHPAKITLFFYNPNIHPKKEFERRLEDVRKIAKLYSVPLIVPEQTESEWHSYIKGFEHEPEKGKRCQLCFELRLKKTAEYAKKHGFQAFATTLTISPHKSAEMINKIGKRYQDQLVKYISSDFKKYKGYELSVALSKQLNLYRQNYCGCVYSKKSSKNQHSISE